MNSDVSLVILIFKGFYRFKIYDAHVFRDWVFWITLVTSGNNLVYVFNPQSFEHLSV